MKNLAFILMLFLFAASVITSQNKSKTKAVGTEQQTPPPPARDGVFIHLSSGSENPHKVLMALTMELKMSEDHDVYVYLDIEAVNLVLTSAKSIEFPKFEASKILISKLIDKNVAISVCPLCLEVYNHTKFDLMKGIKPADKNDFFSFTNGRILTLDY